MIFQLMDKEGTICVVSCSASRKNGLLNLLGNRFTFHSLSIDIPTSDEHLILRGEREDKVYQGKVVLR
jgi:hypothetical protein